MEPCKAVNVAVGFTLAIAWSQVSLAESDETHIASSRYTYEQVGPTRSQRDLLQTIINVKIPERIGTVGEAVDYVLRPYGFRMRMDENTPEEQYVLLVLPLANPHRTLDTMTLMQALTVLGGESFSVVVNPVTRQIAFQLKDTFRSHITESEIRYAKKMWVGREEKYIQATDSIQESVISSYGPVKEGETLSGIVGYFQTNGYTLGQALIEVFNANPNSFASSNMNNLLRGSVLKIPSFNDSPTLSAGEATRIVESHYQSWLEKKVVP